MIKSQERFTRKLVHHEFGLEIHYEKDAHELYGKYTVTTGLLRDEIYTWPMKYCAGVYSINDVIGFVKSGKIFQHAKSCEG